MSNLPTLPAGFEDLQPHADWCLATETERNIHRHEVGMERILAFKDAILPRVDAIVAYLEQNPLEAIPDADMPLMHMLLSLAEIAPVIEFYNQPAVIDGYDPRRFVAEENFVLRPAI